MTGVVVVVYYDNHFTVTIHVGQQLHGFSAYITLLNAESN